MGDAPASPATGYAASGADLARGRGILNRHSRIPSGAWRGVVLVFALLAGAPLAAADWPAVGRLEVAGRTDFCTGTVIAPDLVVTAAHCLFRRGGGVVGPEEVSFRPGLGGPKAELRQARRVMLHPDYMHLPRGPERFAADLALVGLTAPVEAAFAMGFAPRAGDAVTLVFYRNDHGEAVMEQHGCPVLRRNGALLIIACEVGGGASGGAVLIHDADGEAAVATIVARSAVDGAGLAHAVIWDTALPALRAGWEAGE